MYKRQDIDHSVTDPSFRYFIMSDVSHGILSDPSSIDSSFTVITGLSHELIGHRIKYVPNEHYNGIDQFTYRVMDASGGLSSITAEVELSITAVNDFPIVYNLNKTLDEGDEITFDLSASDIDHNVTCLLYTSPSPRD